MRSFSLAEHTHLASRAGVRPRLLVWIVANNLSTGLPEPTGFWNGDQDASFSVGGEVRTYFGAGGLLHVDDIGFEVGLAVRKIGVWLSTSAAEVVDAVMGFDVRLARVEIHRLLTDPVSHQPVADPHRVWKGWADGSPRVTPAKGLNPGRITLTVASAALALTKGSPAKLSDAQWRLSSGGDRILRYADVSGAVPVYWGEQVYTPSPPPSSPGFTIIRPRNDGPRS